MKYLKRYKLFESDSNSEDVQWIKDCLLDLRDSGCDIQIREYSVQVDDSPSIEQSKSMTPAKKSAFSSFKKTRVVPGIVIKISRDRLIPIEVGENLLMIDSYLRERGYVGYNAYDYDNPYSQSRYQVRVDARLKDIKNSYENELSQFVKMLGRFQVNAPFDTIEVKYFKPLKRSIKESWSNIDELEDECKDILIELEDIGLIVSFSRIRKDVEVEPEKYYNKTRTDVYLEVYISRQWGAEARQIPGVVNPEGGYPGNLFFWYEIKESIIRLAEWYYLEGYYEPIDKGVVYRTEKDQSPLRFFASGIEMCMGFSKEEDFKGIGDFISFSNFRIMIKL